MSILTQRRDVKLSLSSACGPLRLLGLWDMFPAQGFEWMVGKGVRRVLERGLGWV